MGSSYEYSSPSTDTTSAAINTYAQDLPGIEKTVNSNIVPTAQAYENATAQTIPELNALDLQQLQQYSLPEAIVGEQVTNQNALAGAQTNLEQITGPGGQAAAAAQQMNQALNPAYYGAINAASQGANSAIGAINLGGLSPGEAAATERSLNQSNLGTGNLGLLNPTNTISNALNFGGAFNNKIGLMNNATNAASNVANAASGNGGFNAVNVALGQPNVSLKATLELINLILVTAIHRIKLVTQQFQQLIICCLT